MEKLKSLIYSLVAFVVLVVLSRFISMNISLIALGGTLLGIVYWNDKVDKLGEDHITSLSRIAVVFTAWATVISFKTFFEIVKGVQAGDVFSGLGYLVLIILAVVVFILSGVVYLFQKSKDTNFSYLLISLLAWSAFYWLLSFGYNDLTYGQRWYDWVLK